MGPLKTAIHHDLFPLSCVQRCLRAREPSVKQCAGPDDLVGLFRSLGLYIPPEMLRGNLAWQGFAEGLKGPAVDKQSFNGR